MKANAPEKIYISPNREESTYYVSNQYSRLIEYTRTDAFIEKALKWYCLDCECNDNCKNTKCFFHNEYKRFLEGEKKAIPPKFSDRILNEDGSTSDNWRYRHFIAKMQDAFIEKAKEWFQKQNEWFDPNGNRHCDLNDFDNFKNYMKGE